MTSRATTGMRNSASGLRSSRLKIWTLSNVPASPACYVPAGSISLLFPVDTLTDALESDNHTERFAPWGWATRALLAYRNGDAELVDEYVANSEQHKPNDFSQALNLAVLAMAQHELGHPDEATAALAEAAQLIVCVDAGEFSPDQSKQRTASYGVRWYSPAKPTVIGSKCRPEPDQFKNQTSIGSESPPEDQFKNQTTKEITHSKDITKQQLAAVDDEVVKLLVDQGLDIRTAQKLSIERGLDVVQRQVEWIDARSPDNRVGMLRKAIDEDWPMPNSMAERQKIEDRRKKEYQFEEKQKAEEAEIATAKKLRAQRKRRLLKEWELASREERNRWIQVAVESEASRMIADMIRRQKSTDHKPHVQILEVVAKERDLPPVLSH